MTTSAAGALIASGMVAVAERPCASDTVTGSANEPGPAVGVTASENTLSPGVTSPPVPLSSSAWTVPGLPKIADRSAATERFVLAGLVPGVTATVRSERFPVGIAGGVAEPVADKATVAEPLFRGVAAPLTKSAELLSVSTAPP